METQVLVFITAGIIVLFFLIPIYFLIIKNSNSITLIKVLTENGAYLLADRNRAKEEAHKLNKILDTMPGYACNYPNESEKYALDWIKDSTGKDKLLSEYMQKYSELKAENKEVNNGLVILRRQLILSKERVESLSAESIRITYPRTPNHIATEETKRPKAEIKVGDKVWFKSNHRAWGRVRAIWASGVVDFASHKNIPLDRIEKTTW